MRLAYAETDPVLDGYREWLNNPLFKEKGEGDFVAWIEADTNPEECERWLPFLANAMAVAAGRTSHGEHSNIRNPHGESLAGYPTERILGEPMAEVDA